MTTTKTQKQNKQDLLKDQASKDLADLIMNDINETTLSKAFALPYSLKNNMLIAKQGGQLVKSFKQWSEDGYKIRKGTKAIRIFAPKIVNDYTSNGRKINYKEYQKLSKQEKAKVTIKKEMIGFQLVPVFDISQTDCPRDKYPDGHFFKERLQGECDQNKYNALVKFIESKGVPVKYGTTAPLKGFYRHGLTIEDIVIENVLNEKEKLAILAHEAGHALMHKNSNLVKWQKELEAESFCYFLSIAIGFETDNSVDYIQGHIRKAVKANKADHEQIIKHLDRSRNLALEISEKLEEIIQNKKQDKTAEKVAYAIPLF